MNKLIPVVKPEITNLDIETVNDCLKREWLGMGKDVVLFEKTVAEIINIDREKVVAISTGTKALEAALRATDKPKGAKVLMPSLNFVGVFPV